MPELPPSGLERSSRALGYIFAGLAGVALLTNPPTSIKDALLIWVSIGIGVFLLGGFIAAVAAYRYLYRIEYVCLAFIGGAFLIYAVAIWSWVFTHPDSGSAQFIAFVASYLVTKITSRFAALHRLIRARKVVV